ncbi:MAG: glycosyltransferase [Candidatus Hodarchaeota archaeon]
MDSLKLKNIFKKFSILNETNLIFKSYYQEHKAKKSLKYYNKKINRNPSIYKSCDVAKALRERLLNRGININPKRKGELHIFLSFTLNNWEKVLPLALKPFGNVSVFEWRSLGFDENSKGWLRYRDSMNAEMIKAFQNANSQQPIDAVVGYLSGYNTSPQVINEIGGLGAIIFNFCWDDKLNFPGRIIGGRYTSPAAIASSVDLNLTNSPESIIKYLAHGGLSIFWPEAAYPGFHKPYDVIFEHDVSFVGEKYGYRPKFIKKLRSMGIKVYCFGIGWENGPVSDEEMVKLYSKSRINLGFSGIGYSKRLMCLKGRDFEVPMSGGLYLTQNNPELSLVYEIGKEIITYENEVDCAKKIIWLLENPKEAKKIRNAGWRRALKDHSWEKRFEDIFRLAGIIN